MENESSKEIVVPKNEAWAPESIPATPSTLLNIAINQGADLDRLEKLMELQIKWEENQAKKSYFVAMASFKAEHLIIAKDNHVKYTRKDGSVVEYDHASLGNVTETLNPILGKYGLSAAWKIAQEPQRITVTCRITHALGYGEETSLWAAPDDSGGKNAIQSLGSTINYLQRYTVLALTGLAAQNQDDDGKGSEEIKYISDKQKSTIVDMINHKEVDESPFLKYMGVNDIDKIKESDFEKAMKALRLAKGKSHASNNT